MATLNLRLSDFDNSILNSLSESTGRTKTSLVVEAIRNLNLELREESGVTHLSSEDFDSFMEKVLHPDADPKVRAARERIMNYKPVWEK